VDGCVVSSAVVRMCMFYQMLCTFILNIYDHLIVLMIANGLKVLVVVKM
jgi:hypothetical protein